MFNRNHVIAFLEHLHARRAHALNAGEPTPSSHAASRPDGDEEQFSVAVEEITGRKVIQFMSQVSFDPDIAAEIFVLEAAAADAA